MFNVISKIIKPRFRYVLMEETYMTEKHETKNDELAFKIQNLTGSSTKVKPTES